MLLQNSSDILTTGNLERDFLIKKTHTMINTSNSAAPNAARNVYISLFDFSRSKGRSVDVSFNVELEELSGKITGRNVMKGDLETTFDDVVEWLSLDVITSVVVRVVRVDDRVLLLCDISERSEPVFGVGIDAGVDQPDFDDSPVDFTFGVEVVTVDWSVGRQHPG